MFYSLRGAGSSAYVEVGVIRNPESFTKMYFTGDNKVPPPGFNTRIHFYGKPWSKSGSKLADHNVNTLNYLSQKGVGF